MTVGLPALAAAVLVVVAFTSAPLTVTVDGAAASGTGALSWDHVVVTVRNTSSSALTPRFMVSSGGGHPTGFWSAQAVQGTDPVPPGGSTRFVLRPSASVPAPGHGQMWLVEAYSSPPDALSTSSLQEWTLGSPQS